MERGQELLEGRGNGRRGLTGLAFCLCLLVALVVVLPAAPSIAKKHKAVSLHFKGAQSDTALLASGTIPVVARSSKARKVQLSVTSFQGGPALTDPRRVKLRRGTKKVALTLSTTGKEVLQGCAASHLTVTATGGGKRKKGKKSAAKALGRSSASIAQSAPQCAALKNAARCETIASPGTNCLFPWPSDHYTVSTTPATPTGRRVNLSIDSTPANVSRRPHRPGRHQPKRRLQSRREHRHARPGPRQSDRLPEDGRRPAHRHGPGVRAEPADRADRRRHRAAPADLVGARRQRLEPWATPT